MFLDHEAINVPLLAVCWRPGKSRGDENLQVAEEKQNSEISSRQAKAST